MVSTVQTALSFKHNHVVSKQPEWYVQYVLREWSAAFVLNPLCYNRYHGLSRHGQYTGAGNVKKLCHDQVSLWYLNG